MASKSNSEIRQALLAETPKGTSGVKVLTFIVGTLKPRDRVDVYRPYVDAVEASICERLPVMTTTKRTIEVVLHDRPIGIMISELTRAVWKFDDRDRLVDITVERLTMGP